tara:strand:+ start:96 stop:509 length:414 start_codon:yes stop_codon:yes gene_type:complete
MNKNLQTLFRFDKIRICKILEMSQYCIIGFTLTLIIGNFLNIYILSDDDLRNKSSLYLFFNIMIELIIIVIILYYIKKLINCFPYMFSFISKKYIPSFKNESNNGYIIGSSIILMITLTNLDNKLNELDKRFKNRFK